LEKKPNGKKRKGMCIRWQFLFGELGELRSVYSWTWWYMPIIPALGKLRQEGL
jgi:hypothetical protein